MKNMNDYSYAAQKLAQKRIRATAFRLVVLQTLLRANKPLSLNEIEQGVSKTSHFNISGIPRILKLFEDQNIIRITEHTAKGILYEVIRKDEGYDREELRLAFVCERCGLTVPLKNNVFIPRIPIPKRYTVYGLNCFVTGVCDKCNRLQ